MNFDPKDVMNGGVSIIFAMMKAKMDVEAIVRDIRVAHEKGQTLPIDYAQRIIDRNERMLREL